MKKFLIALSALIVLGGAFIVYRTLKVPETPIHYHANFAVFINKNQVNFADPNYMHLAPCVANNAKVSFNKQDNVHLHDLVGNVVHVHQGKIVWNDLFSSVKFDLNKAASGTPLNFYLNGKKTDKSDLSKVIGKEDKLLITTDAPATPDQFAAIGDTAKDYDNGTKGAEHCGAEGKRSFTTRLKIALQTLFSDIEI